MSGQRHCLASGTGKWARAAWAARDTTRVEVRERSRQPPHPRFDRPPAADRGSADRSNSTILAVAVLRARTSGTACVNSIERLNRQPISYQTKLPEWTLRDRTTRAGTRAVPFVLESSTTMMALVG